MGRRPCEKHEHTLPEHRTKDGRCKACVAQASARYRARAREAYKAFREMTEKGK